MSVIIQGVDLNRVKDLAGKAFVKIAESRLVEYLRGLKVKAHNQQMKAARLRGEADEAEKAQKEVESQIARIEAGDWEAVEFITLEDKDQKDQKGDRP